MKHFIQAEPADKLLENEGELLEARKYFATSDYKAS